MTIICNVLNYQAIIGLSRFYLSANNAWYDYCKHSSAETTLKNHYLLFYVSHEKDSVRGKMSDSKLNEMDKVFYTLECLGYPPFARIHFDLSGGYVDIGLLRQAYLLVIERYPVFNSTIEDRSSGLKWELYWVPGKKVDEQQVVRLCDFSHLTREKAEEKFKNIQFDPFKSYSARKTPPFMMVLCKYPDNHYKLIAFFHHAAADAHGYSMFLKDLFYTYNQLEAHRTLPVYDPVVHTSPLLPQTMMGKVSGFFEGLCILIGHFLKCKGKDFAKVASGQNKYSGRISAIQRALEAHRLQKYLSASKYFGVTLTEFLIAAQMVALDRWKVEYNEPCETISVQVQKNLRKSNAELRELANKFSPFLITTSRENRTKLSALINHIHQLSQSAKNSNMAEKNICLLWILNNRFTIKCLSVLAPYFFNNQRLGDSFVVSNIGRFWDGANGRPTLTHLGNSEIISCYFAGPPMPPVGTLSGYWTFRNRLCFSFNYFPQSLSDEAAIRYVDIFEEVIDEMAGLAH
jgi:NRPS condensation-like uncharacterized protein